VFVHGLFSQASVWDRYIELIDSDANLSRFKARPFSYNTPKFLLRRVSRRIPSFDDIADKLKTFIEVECAEYSTIALVTHSQGGLIAQRYLERMLNDGYGFELSKIKVVTMFACPNSGSEVLGTIRKGLRPFWRHPQEKELRPLDASVAQTQRKILRDVVLASGVSTHQCHIPFYVYAGDSDNVVRRASAVGFFPDAYVLDGDHNSIIQPDSHEHGSYKALRKRLIDTFGASVVDEETKKRSATKRAALVFSWTSDLNLADIESALGRAVASLKEAWGVEIHKLRFEGEVEASGGNEAARPLIDRIVKASQLAIIIAEEASGSPQCKQLMRAAADSDVPIVLLSPRELSTLTTLEVLDIRSDHGDVDCRTYASDTLDTVIGELLVEYLQVEVEGQMDQQEDAGKSTSDTGKHHEAGGK
jgi:pimeloyl-ACP methyl ester carboxylesterase